VPSDKAELTAWVDDWSLHGLSKQYRARIKARLLQADAAFFDSSRIACISRSTISAGFIPVCVSRQRWNRNSLITFGNWRNCWRRPKSGRWSLLYNCPQMRMLFGVVIIALGQMPSCDSNQPKPLAAPSKSIAKVRPPLHRFVLTRFPTDAGVAFDTQTGQICRTWEWVPSGPNVSLDILSRAKKSDIRIGEFAPTCLSLYEKYPSGPGDGTSVTEDQQSDSK
jgi:hypothetical protein